METSQDIKEIAIALVKVQSALGKAKKDSENPHFKSKYADLEAVWDACQSALQAAEVAVVQGPGVDDHGNAFVETMLLHKSGQFIKSRATARPISLDPQKVGSATTYLRRYGLAAMVGVVQEDDDGNGSSKQNDTSPKAELKPTANVTRGVSNIKKPEPIIDPVAAQDTAEELIKQIKAISLAKNLEDWGKRKADLIHGLPTKEQDLVRTEYNLRQSALKTQKKAEAA